MRKKFFLFFYVGVHGVNNVNDFQSKVIVSVRRIKCVLDKEGPSVLSIDERPSRYNSEVHMKESLVRNSLTRSQRIRYRNPTTGPLPGTTLLIPLS